VDRHSIFIPDEMLLKAICIAAKRGWMCASSCRGIQSSACRSGAASYLREAQESGVKICNFTPGMMHAKAILVDGALGIVGSMNMDMRSFFLNYEVALFISNENMVQELDRWVTDLLVNASGHKKANIPLNFLKALRLLRRFCEKGKQTPYYNGIIIAFKYRHHCFLPLKRKRGPPCLTF